MFRAKGHRDLKLKPRYRQRDFNEKVKSPWLQPQQNKRELPIRKRDIIRFWVIGDS